MRRGGRGRLEGVGWWMCKDGLNSVGRDMGLAFLGGFIIW